MSDNNTCYRRNKEILQEKAKEYYENNNEKLQKQAPNKYRALSNEKNIYKKRICKKLI